MREIIEVQGRKEKYSVIITLDEKGKIQDAICDCMFGSLYPDNFRNGNGLCIHIKKALKEKKS